MKKITLFSFYILLILLSNFVIYAQVGIGTTTPRGALEINSSTNGFVPPQVALTSITTSDPIVDPQTKGSPIVGTIVYNTAIAGTSPNNVTPGYYFWNGISWTRFAADNTATNTEENIVITIDKATNPEQLGSLTGIPGPQICFFRDGEGIESMSFTVQLPNNWEEGTTIYPNIHWVPKTSDSGNIIWNFEYTWANKTTGTFSAVTTSSVIEKGPFIMNQHLSTNLTSGNTGIDGNGKTHSSLLICRIWRDSSTETDTYNGDAGGLTVDFRVSIKNNMQNNTSF